MLHGAELYGVCLGILSETTTPHAEPLKTNRVPDNLPGTLKPAIVPLKNSISGDHLNAINVTGGDELKIVASGRTPDYRLRVRLTRLLDAGPRPFPSA